MKLTGKELMRFFCHPYHRPCIRFIPSVWARSQPPPPTIPQPCWWKWNRPLKKQVFFSSWSSRRSKARKIRTDRPLVNSRMVVGVLENHKAIQAEHLVLSYHFLRFLFQTSQLDTRLFEKRRKKISTMPILDNPRLGFQYRHCGKTHRINALSIFFRVSEIKSRII